MMNEESRRLPPPIKVELPEFTRDQIDYAIERWLRGYREGESRDTARYVASNFLDFLDSRGVPLLEATEIEADDWLTQQRAAGNAPKTLAKKIAVGSSLYGWFIRRRYTLFNAFAEIPRPSVERAGSAQWLSLEEMQDRLGRIDRGSPAGLRDYTLLTLAFHTGLRCSTVAGLRGTDLVRRNGSLVVRGCTKGGTEYSCELDPAPTGYSLVNTLLEYLGAVNPGDRPVFKPLSPNGNGHGLTRQSLHRLSRARLGINFHSLRHSFAVLLLEQGRDPYYVQAALGHKSLEHVETYCHYLETRGVVPGGRS